MTPILLLCLLGADVGSDPVEVAPARVVDANDRVVAAAGAAVGGAAGGFVGGSVALGLAAALSGFDARAALLPLIALPPLLSAAGAFIVGTAVADSNVGLAGAAGAGIGCAAWAVVLGALLVGNESGLLADRADVTFAATAIVPAVIGVVGASLAAPWFAPAME